MPLALQANPTDEALDGLLYRIQYVQEALTAITDQG